MKKDTIYIDNDDEITSITDKVQTAKNQIVALVLPKRCTVLQSSVNMKILNRAASSAGKKLVLITSEKALLPVAGAAGVFVAKTLQSKPVIPAAATEPDEVIDTVDESDVEVDASKSIGELAGAMAVATAAVSDDEETPIELGDEPESDSPKKSKKDKKDSGEKKNKKLAVPNFDSFRVKLFAGIGGVILLIVLWYLASVVLPRAVITISTENKSVPIDMTVTASASAQSIDADKKIVPATTKTETKTETKKFSATGEKNVGEKSTGSMTIYNCTDNTVTLPAGTTFTTNSLSFVTTAPATVPGSNFTSGGICKNDGNISGVSVVASNSGDQYNVSGGRIYTSSYSPKITGKGSVMVGGTNQVVKVVSQSDCDSAKNDLLNSKSDTYKTDLSKQLTDAGYTPLPDTFVLTPSKVSCSPDVGAQATEATASVTFNASMTGVSTAGLTQLLQNEATKNIKSTQSVLDPGIKTATYTVKSTGDNGDVTVQIRTDAQVGVKQDPDAIAKAVVGKKRGETDAAIRALPGVTDVKIEYKPFWVDSTPKNVKHITIKFVNNGSN